ncbi:MAG TPA: DUF5995 family protein [Intrasporangium sp.]|nr:DUF5995 family protein [Intrasporangium sp.]
MGWFSHLLDLVRRKTSRREDPPAGQLASIDAVCARMRTLELGLDLADGLAAFNGMYLRVTELVRDRIAEGYFRNPEFLTRLDIVFAGLYLEAVDAAHPVSAWAPLFETRHEPGRVPIQYALAGMNAHINHDLPIAVVRACRQLGLTPGSRDVEADYRRVTDLLGEVQEQVRQSFLDGLALDLDRRYAAPIANLVSSWSIGRARDAAWVNALVLWQLGEMGALRDDFLDTLSSSVGLTSRVLLTPVAQLV